MSEEQPNNPLHGITLKAIVEDLVERRGWEDLGAQVPIRCFIYDPSVRSSLKFLRKTPWARAKVEALYLADMRRQQRRKEQNRRRAERRAQRGAAPDPTMPTHADEPPAEPVGDA